MTERGYDLRRVCRRSALTGTAVALGAAAAAAVIPHAGAQQKISQALAKYQDGQKGDDHCAACDNFQSPNACKFVEGKISPQGWCQLFTPRS